MLSVYKHYVIKAGEDLRVIAQKLYNDIDQWQTLAKLNHLKYPYIVSSPEEQLKDPDHLLTWGQSLLLPNSNDIDTANSNLIEESNTAHYKNYYYDTSLGMDLKLNISTDSLLTEQLGVLQSDDTGYTFERVSGLANLQQSLILRILTRRGTLLMHPNYGSRLVDMLGQPMNDKLLSEAAVELRRTITTDSRVADCKITKSQLTYNEIFLNATVTPINYDQAFDLYLYRSKTGNISLR